ncbi:tetratricopeptide repeat protein [Nonomuraea typhae]|uniref:tetratricopeptide repeat protein n=1 Tax=Nonomuraea typhae TaxID=2603600 RepID=UPI0015E242D3|nr:tetratricopeptide repeat protein [Nonomuraea typhae]
MTQDAAGERAVAAESIGERAIVIPGDHNTVHVGTPAAAGQLVVGDIPQRPPAFQERPGIMSGLRADDRVSVVRSVTGAPGVGKTTMAAAYARECQAAGFAVVAWIHAETHDQIVTGLGRLAGRAGLRESGDSTVEAAEKAHDWLAAQTRPCLLVFDNAAGVAELRRWVPATGNVQTVITTRDRAFDRLGARVPVEVFTERESVAFLERATGLGDPSGAAALARELGHLALALAQAAALIEERGTPYAGYLASLRRVPLDRNLRRIEGDAYPDSVVQAVILAVEAAEAEVAGAAELLSAISVLSPDGVPTYLLGPAEDDDVRDLLAALARRSLLSWSQDRLSVVAHRVTQRVLRERDPGATRRAVDRATVLLTAYRPTDMWVKRDRWESFVTQTEAVYRHAAGRAVPDLISLLQLAIAYKGRHSSNAEAVRIYEDCLADFTRVLGPDDAATLNVRSDLAFSYSHLRQPERAIELYQQSIADHIRVFGSDHPGTLKAYAGLAGAHSLNNDPMSAMPMYERAVNEHTRILGPAHRTTLGQRNLLALTVSHTGDHPRAITLMEATLVDCERELGVDDPDTLMAGRGLAMVAGNAGDDERATLLYRECVAGYERVLGADNMFTLQTKAVFAEYLALTGRPEPARELYAEIMEIAERVLGAGHGVTEQAREQLDRLAGPGR